ncbi:OmpA family protein [Parvicella tangerina]|uniref:Peptidoglycan-associated lipoprotein n=1 Tax=Parvicella tangerina TaxID=2829795 RepID=A0A916JPE5_9FLAO|nr:OmpA family protein [Parvicella tangerina]CAG5086082.1 Peptidoglycan-associated lipoprotein [Parvicella tangerina]
MKKWVLIILTLICSGHIFGQSKSEWLYNADKYYLSEDYASALKYYSKILNDSVIMSLPVLPYESQVTSQKLKNKKIQIDSTKSVSVFEWVHHQIGMCYYYTRDYSHAEAHFVETADSSAFLSDRYYYAVALMNNDKHELALPIFESIAKSKDYNLALRYRCKSHIKGCYYKINDKFETKAIVELADTSVFNKGSASFAPMWWGSEEKIIFTSAREGGVILDPLKQNSEFLCDLYWSERIDSTTWGVAHNFGRPLNSARHDASGSSNGNNIIFYTRWSDEDNRNKQIHLARGIGLKFFESYKLDSAVNLPGYKSINPHVSSDGKTLFYSSDRPGGLGGMDIWMVRIDESGNPTSRPKNLGAPINSKNDEVTPFFHEPSSTLFFASDGHESIGGLDIFKSHYDRAIDYYAEPQNLGEPINSSQDDAYLIFDALLKKGFFASDREPCENGHCYNIYEITNEPIKIMIEGIVFDAMTDDVIPNTTITFKDVRYSKEPFEVMTDEEGYYSTELQQNDEWFMKATKPSYFADASNVDTRKITETTWLMQDFYLTNIPTGEIEIPGIEYDFDSDKLRDTSMAILDELVEFLELNDNLVVELNSHTDARGNDKYNLDLSDRRAKSCVDYLISKGISKSRLIPKGYGESQPAYLKDENGDPVIGADGKKIFLTEEYINSINGNNKQNSLHQKNRRTTFKVVGEDFKLESL